MDAIRETVLIFEKLKEEIILQFKEQNDVKVQLLTKLQTEATTYDNQMQALKDRINDSIDITRCHN